LGRTTFTFDGCDTMKISMQRSWPNMVRNFVASKKGLVNR
jgi:hypothetical protein